MNLMNIFGVSEISNSITVLDIIRDFAESNQSSNPIKGGLALSYLYDDKQPSARNTIDIDYHFEKVEDWNLFKTDSIEKANRNTKLGVQYKIIKVKENANGESLTVEFNHKDLSGKFKVDMNYGTYCKTINLNNIILYSPEMIIADKLSVICSPKIQRRCKDLYDIYLVAKHEKFNLKALVNEIDKKLKSRNINLDKLSLLNPEILYNLQIGYRKLKLIDMPTFEEVCKLDLKFILPILSLMDGMSVDNIEWNCDESKWNTGKIYGSRIATDLHGIICRESASGLLHLSTFPPYPVLLSNDKIDLNMEIVRFSTESYNEEYLEKLKDGLFITNEERTIVDMLETGEYRILQESLETYIDKHNNNIDKLVSVAEYYGKKDILMKELKENKLI